MTGPQIFVGCLALGLVLGVIVFAAHMWYFHRRDRRR